MPRCRGGTHQGDVHGQLLGQLANQAHRVGPVRRAAIPLPSGRDQLAGEHRPQVERLPRQRRQELLEIVRIRTAVHTEDRRWTVPDREGDGPGLEETHAWGPAAEVPGRSPEQARQQGGGVRRLLAGQRVLQQHGVPALVVAGQTECVERVLPDEREADHLDQPGAGQSAAHPATQALSAGQAGACGCLRNHRRDVLVADLAGHLLHQVVRVAHVGTPRRDHDVQSPVTARHRAAHRLQQPHRVVVGDRHAGHPGGETRRGCHAGTLGRRTHHRHAGLHGATAVRREELGDPVGRRLRELRIHPALEPLGCLGPQLVPLLCPEHRDRLEVRGLDDDIGGRRRDLRALAPHHPRKPDRPGVVGDQQVGRVQSPGNVVESRQGLPGPRPADPDRTGELRAVVAVDRVAQLEHDVIGDVDRQRDGAHPALPQAPSHPRRRLRSRIEAGHGARDEHRASHRVVHHDRIARVVRSRQITVGRVAIGKPVRQRGLSADAPEGQGVGTVGVDLELDRGLAEAEGVEGGLPRLGTPGGQHDDARMVVSEAELAFGADHPGRHVAVGLPCADLEAPGQHRSGQRHHDEIAGPEVVRPADDPLGLAAAIGIPDVDRAPVDRLAVLLRFLDGGEDAADHQGTGDLVTEAVQRLELEPEGSEAVGKLLGGHALGQVGHLGDPADGCAHPQISVPKAEEKRTSPSKKSRRSPAP